MNEKSNNPGDVIYEKSNENSNENSTGNSIKNTIPGDFLPGDAFPENNIDNSDDWEDSSENDIRPGEITKDDIYEGNAGVSALPCEEIIPPVAECIYHTKSFEFSLFTDKETKKGYFGIKVISYHSGELKISMKMLEKIVKYLKKRYR